MAKKRLKIDAEFDFILIGMVSALPDYRMAWYISQVLHQPMIKTGDHVLVDEKNMHTLSFSRYHGEESITKSEFWLLQNKHELDFLIPETKELDYFLIIIGEYYKLKEKEIVRSARSIPEVQAAVSLQPAQLKSKHQLIFGISAHQS